MDPLNLTAASTYVNNLLLARGLLRGSRTVDFPALVAPALHPQRDLDQTLAGKATYGDRTDNGTGETEEGDGEGKENQPERDEDRMRRAKRKQDKERRAMKKRDETAVQVVNLVHDLILRRDRDADSLSSLSTTISSMRTAQTSQSSSLAHLQAENVTLRQQLATARTEARTSAAAHRSADILARTHREETARLKIMLSQVRAQCTHDVRKRDLQLQKLKSHLSAAQRGTSGRAVGASCVVTACDDTESTHGKEAEPSLEDAAYSLKQETNEFLTQLSQSLSEENDALIGLVNATVGTLRTLLEVPPSDGTIGHSTNTEDGDMVVIVPTSYDVLEKDVQFVLEKLALLLTRDDFAPVSEVYARDEEIGRLGEVLQRVEGRWGEAVSMMKGWQKRMLAGGGNVELKELAMGLNLGEGLEGISHQPMLLALTDAQHVPMKGVPEEPEDESEILDQALHSDHEHLEETDSEHSLTPPKHESHSFLDDLDQESSPLPQPPISRALRDITDATPESPSTKSVQAQQQRRGDDTLTTKTQFGALPRDIRKTLSSAADETLNSTTSSSVPPKSSSSSRFAQSSSEKSSIPASSSAAPSRSSRPPRPPPHAVNVAQPKHSPIHRRDNGLLSSASLEASPTKSTKTSSAKDEPASIDAGSLRRRPARSEISAAPKTSANSHPESAQAPTRPRPDGAKRSTASTTRAGYRPLTRDRSPRLTRLSIKEKLALAEEEARRASIAQLPTDVADDADADADAGAEGEERDDYEELGDQVRPASSTAPYDLSAPGEEVEEADDDLAELARGDRPASAADDEIAEGMAAARLASGSPPPRKRPEKAAPQQVPTKVKTAPRSLGRPSLKGVTVRPTVVTKVRRGKRKSTLSPEELEELMGLRS